MASAYIMAFAPFLSLKIRGNYYSGKYRVKFGHFLNFSIHIILGKNIGVGSRGQGHGGGHTPLKISGKIFFGQLLRKIRAFIFLAKIM